MSCFAGKLNEYPYFSVDCFNKHNLDSEVYFLSHCHQDHMNGLDSTAFFHRLQTRQNILVYCSETTRNILLCDERYKHLEMYLAGLPIEHPTVITFNRKETGKRETVSVTLLSAGHCIGSVMFLFEGVAGTVLYTGDFRWSKGDARRISFFHSGDSVKDISSMYVDTTFYLPQMKQIPSRESTKNAVLKLIERWLSKGSNYYVSLLCKGMYGYEYLLQEVAMVLHTKIHVSSERLSLYKNLPNMIKHFTTNGETTRIHSCNWEHKRSVNSKLPCGFSLPAPQKVKVMKIKATSMWFARRSEPLPSDCIFQVSEDFYRVVHSMHASMDEVIDLVSYLRPLHVFPTVEPAGLQKIKDAQESLQQYTRCEDEFNRTLKERRVSSQNYHGTEETPVLFKEQKSIVFSNMCNSVPHFSPSNEVLAECNQLGLEEENLMIKPCQRRRRHETSSEICDQGKITTRERTSEECESSLHKRRIIEHSGSKRARSSTDRQTAT